MLPRWNAAVVNMVERWVGIPCLDADRPSDAHADHRTGRSGQTTVPMHLPYLEPPASACQRSYVRYDLQFHSPTRRPGFTSCRACPTDFERRCHSQPALFVTEGAQPHLTARPQTATGTAEFPAERAIAPSGRLDDRRFGNVSARQHRSRTRRSILPRGGDAPSSTTYSGALGLPSPNATR